MAALRAGPVCPGQAPARPASRYLLRKISGGHLLGQFSSLVNPGGAIPERIAALTGISDAMVAAAPPLVEVLPAFLAFARGCVLTAHNAPFDVGFLKHFSRELGIPWPGFETLDTAILARRVLSREEVPNCKLATLAAWTCLEGR